MWHSTHDFHKENKNIGGLSSSRTLSPPIISPFLIPPLTSRHLSQSHSTLPYTSPPPHLSHLPSSSATFAFPLPSQPHPSLRSPNHFLPHGRQSLVGPCEFFPSTSLHITPIHTLSYCHLQMSHWSQTKTIHGLETSGWTRRSHWHRMRSVMGVRPSPNTNEDSY
jgi:hypothetical protein